MSASPRSARRTVIVLADWQGRLLAILALGLGLVAWIRIVRHLAAGDAIRFVATALWGVLALVAAVGAMVGASWLLGASSAVHHPWYASPMRACALIAVSGILGPWLLTRLALVVPERVRYVREPASVWALTLPLWCVDRGGLRDQGAAGLAALGPEPGDRRRRPRRRAAGTHRVDARRVAAGAGRDARCCSSATA